MARQLMSPQMDGALVDGAECPAAPPTNVTPVITQSPICCPYGITISYENDFCIYLVY